jgi:hypothetical protein
MIGTDTDKDVNELHVNVDYIKKHEQELEEAVLINTNTTANIAKNVTAFVQQWNEAVREDVSTMRRNGCSGYYYNKGWNVTRQINRDNKSK